MTFFCLRGQNSIKNRSATFSWLNVDEIAFCLLISTAKHFSGNRTGDELLQVGLMKSSNSERTFSLGSSLEVHLHKACKKFFNEFV